MLKLCIFAAVIHILFLYSVFDLYFTSPLVPVSRRFAISNPPVAKRLVLFVCDGLRVDKFFANNVLMAPFLRRLMENGAVFGVSNTKVPTESRPGHVAMIAGFYEDVAAITKGWKENPVEFDSLFNQSRHTWSWGSPDILPMFEKGAVPGRVSINMYDSSFEDFAKDASILDTWVFDQVKQFFEEKREDPTILNEDRLVFFLHLLGTDTIGHADKPHSAKYMDNIALVDRGVERIFGIINKFFNHDNATTFIFSSDHGMRDWGSHGAGHPDETMTPFVGWGAGFSSRNIGKWRDLDFSDVARLPQMFQADIAPLMACLIGANYPANSVGKVPVEFLSVDDKYKAECLLANAQQLAETALSQHNAYRAGSLLSFSPYPDFDIDLIEQNLAVMMEMASKGQLKAVQQQASVFIDHMLAATRYYHTYNNTYIGFAVSSGYLLWIAYVVFKIMNENSDSTNRHLESSRFNLYSCKNFVYFAISGIVFMILLLKKSPLSHYAYWLLPVYLGCDVLFGLQRSGYSFGQFALSFRNWICFIAVLCGLEATVWGYWYRRAVTVAIIGAALFATVFTSRRQSFLFPLAICSLAVFPLLPPADSGQQTFELVYAVAVFVGVISVLSFRYFAVPHCVENCKRARIVQCLMLLAAVTIKMVTVRAIANNSPVPIFCHVISWLLLLAVWLPPLFTCPETSGNSRQGRIFAIFLSIFTIYSLLSVYYESLYLVVLQFVLLIWISNASSNSSNKPKSNFGLIVADSFLLVIFINVSLLAPANIAVINSFDLVSVYTFLTLFAPFIIMTLLIVKVILPLLCVVIAFVEICHARQYSLTTSLLLVMALSDFTALHFFFSVKTEGSWLEIGTSLSHYCIQMFAAVALIPFVAISMFLLFSQPKNWPVVRRLRNLSHSATKQA